MASIFSMISFIVLLLATYSSSAPLVPELQNATSVPEVENATGAFHFDNLIVLARREVSEEKAVTDTVGLSSSSSEDDTDKSVQTTEKLALREMEDTSFPSSSETNNVEREFDTEVNTSSDDNSNHDEQSFTAEVNTEGAVQERRQHFPNDGDNHDERSITEESFTTEVNHKDDTDVVKSERDYGQSFNNGLMNDQQAAGAASYGANQNDQRYGQSSYGGAMNDKRDTEVQSFESSTVDETSVAPSSEVKNVKRSMDNGPWLSAQTADADDRRKRSLDNGPWLSAQTADADDRRKRSLDNGPWLSAQTADADDRRKRSLDNGPWLSARYGDADDRRKRSLDNGPWLSADSNEKVQKRSIEDVTLSTSEDEKSTVEDSSVPSSSEVTNTRRDMQQPSALSDQASIEFNRRAIGPVEINESSTIIDATIQAESRADEQPTSSAEVIREEMSSTVEFETTVTPVDDSTRPSPVPSESKSKILAIIPGQISKSQMVIDPATGKTAGFRPLHQVQLSQGQNETVAEEKKPNY